MEEGHLQACLEPLLTHVTMSLASFLAVSPDGSQSYVTYERYISILATLQITMFTFQDTRTVDYKDW